MAGFAMIEAILDLQYQGSVAEFRNWLHDDRLTRLRWQGGTL